MLETAEFLARQRDFVPDVAEVMVQAVEVHAGPEPLPGVTAQSRCRSQATPQSRRMVYEIHVGGLTTGPEPVLYAEAMVSVDGVHAFHSRNLALRLVGDTLPDRTLSN
ncbi:hypothetical protein [Streptomyces luteireticuli]|uniref:Uncharacterized protein n=1 Tax=Streptomyces luteireticuli TaxID=173858 RepID=A0ABN0YXV9_9ACTN